MKNLLSITLGIALALGSSAAIWAAAPPSTTATAQESSDQPGTDTWITTRAHSKFVGEDLLKDSDIKVDSKDHVVTLRGTVMSAAGRARAVEQAKEVEGVQRVIDRLTIGPKK